MRVQRKLLITVAEWTEGTGSSATTKKEILGWRTPDSSIEYNPDKQKTTDVLGITYGDIEKTEPTQTFDPHYVNSGSDLDTYLKKAAMENDIDAYNGAFTVYVIDATQDSGSGSSHAYYAVKHTGCTISPTSLGGENYVSMPIEVDYSNNITVGTVSNIAPDSGSDTAITFTFTEA